MPCYAVASCGQLAHGVCGCAVCARVPCLASPGVLVPARSFHVLLCRACSVQPVPAMFCYAELVQAGAPLPCLAMLCFPVTAPSSHLWLYGACGAAGAIFVASRIPVPARSCHALLCPAWPCQLVRAMPCCAVRAGDSLLEHWLATRACSCCRSCHVLICSCQLWRVRSPH